MRIELKLGKQHNSIDIKNIESEYETTDDIFNEDSQLFKKLIYIINNKLTQSEKNIILYYAESKRQKDVADKLGVSIATANKTINLIREKIKTYLNNNGNNIKSNTDNINYSINN